MACPGCGWKPFSFAEGAGFCSPDLDIGRWTSWANRLTDLLETADAVPIRHLMVHVPGRRTWRVTGAEGYPVVVKRYGAGAEAGHPGGLSTGEMATRAFERQIALDRKMQPVPEPLLILAVGNGAARTWHAVSRLLDGCVPLVDFAFENLRRRTCTTEMLRGWIDDAISAVISLHRAGYAHGDLQPSNILAKWKLGTKQLELYWTDFDTCEYVGSQWPHDAQIRDLALFGASIFKMASATELRRGLASYLALAGLDPASESGSRRFFWRTYRDRCDEIRTGFEAVEQQCMELAQQALELETSS